MAIWFSYWLAFVIGVAAGALTRRRFRRDRTVWAKRKLQLWVLSLELRELRDKVATAQGRRTPPARCRLKVNRPTPRRALNAEAVADHQRLISSSRQCLP